MTESHDMVRVFLIGVLALVALALVAVNLPERGRPHPDGGDPQSASTARIEGLWEGTLTAYRPDGTVEQSLKESRLVAKVSPGERALTITRLLPGGGSEELSGSEVEAAGGDLKRRIQVPGGGLAVLSGKRVGPAIFWHRQDAASGLKETLREEILETPGGDLYTLDGMRATGGQLLILEGRYRRADRTPR